MLKNNYNSQKKKAVRWFKELVFVSSWKKLTKLQLSQEKSRSEKIF